MEKKIVTTVELLGMKFRAYHGCLESERSLGNDFVVDLHFEYDATAAAQSDDIADAQDYSLVYDIVKREMDRPSNLLENVAYRIKSSVQKSFPGISSLKVEVSKLNPPVDGEVYCSKAGV